MAERAAKVLADAGLRDASVERHSGHVVGELLRQAESASMLVVGSQGHGRVGEVVVGSVSQHLARHATCTVVVVREPRTPGRQLIVVGVDGSPSSKVALEAACLRAERTGEELLAVHGWRVRVPSTDVWNAEPRSIEGMEERERLLAESVAGVASDHPDVVLQQEVVPVAPEQVLVDASSRASLVVVGSRGLGFFSGLLLGSVSQDVLARAHCPVMVVR
jgi:nucleotide-binding universal stress UspA family protein